MKIYEHLWKSIKIYEKLCKSMKINENLWKSMKMHEHQWKSMKIYKNLCKSMKTHENQKLSLTAGREDKFYTTLTPKPLALGHVFAWGGKHSQLVLEYLGGHWGLPATISAWGLPTIICCNTYFRPSFTLVEWPQRNYKNKNTDTCCCQGQQTTPHPSLTSFTL